MGNLGPDHISWLLYGYGKRTEMNKKIQRLLCLHLIIIIFIVVAVIIMPNIPLAGEPPVKLPH